MSEINTLKVCIYSDVSEYSTISPASICLSYVPKKRTNNGTLLSSKDIIQQYFSNWCKENDIEIDSVLFFNREGMVHSMNPSLIVKHLVYIKLIGEETIRKFRLLFPRTFVVSIE